MSTDQDGQDCTTRKTDRLHAGCVPMEEAVALHARLADAVVVAALRGALADFRTVCDRSDDIECDCVTGLLTQLRAILPEAAPDGR